MRERKCKLRVTARGVRNHFPTLDSTKNAVLPADVVSGVVEVVGVAPEWGVVAQVLTVLAAGDSLVHGVDRLENLALGLVVQAELLRLVDAAICLR